MFAPEGADKDLSEKRNINKKYSSDSDFFASWALGLGLSGFWVFLDFEERIGLRFVHKIN